MADRETYEAWIARTHATQRTLKLGLVPGVIGAFVVMAFSRPLGGLILVSVGIVALFGFWITNGHITEWSNRIDAIDRPPVEKTKDGRVRRQRD